MGSVKGGGGLSPPLDHGHNGHSKMLRRAAEAIATATTIAKALLLMPINRFKTTVLSLLDEASRPLVHRDLKHGPARL